MLKLLSDSNAVLNVDDFYIREQTSGLDELIFTMSIYDENYPHVLEEAVIEYEQPYLVKAIDAGADMAKVKCQLDLDALKATLTVGYSNGSNTLYGTVSGVLPAGWTFLDNSGSTISRTIEGNYTPLEVIQQCVDTYGVVFRFDVKNKIVRAYTLTDFQPIGAFASRELNLTEVNFKGKSTDFYTRLYAYGKDGLSFANINNGLPYVDYNEYSDKVICRYWEDDRYTVAENLLAAAQEAVKAGGTPQRSYECSVYDLAATNPEIYSWQDFSLFSVVKLIDDIKGISLNYQVVERQVYPYYPEKNVVTLSSTAPKIQNTVKNIQVELENPNSNFRQSMQNFINSLAASITGEDGGNLRFTFNTEGQPNGIMIMDTADESTAQKILWFNLSGILYSSNGVNGPFDSVWSFAAGGFIADWIVAGTMLANIIHGGTLTLGGQGNGNGICRVLDANGNEVIRLDNAGIKILKGLLQIGSLFSVDTAGNVIANSLQSSNAQITGGSIQIQAMAEYYEPIKLSTYDGWSIAMGPNGVTSRSPNGTYSRVSPAGVDTGTYSGTAMTLKARMTPEGSILAQNAYDNVTSESPNVNVLINGLFRRSASSSRKYKIDITDVIPENLNPEKLYEISVKSFKYKEGYLAKDDQRAKQDIIGLIAEEVAEVYPQAVNYVNGKPEMWNAQILIPAMLKLIQSQNERIKRLECQL